MDYVQLYRMVEEQTIWDEAELRGTVDCMEERMPE